jgi:hypothetical protein
MSPFSDWIMASDGRLIRASEIIVFSEQNKFSTSPKSLVGLRTMPKEYVEVDLSTAQLLEMLSEQKAPDWNVSIPTEKKPEIYLPQATKRSPAEQCRELGISIGDTIEGEENGTRVRLKLIWLGQAAAIWMVYLKENGLWIESEESANWTLVARKWRRVLREQIIAEQSSAKKKVIWQRGVK